ncbi:AAA family ATPase [Nocardioides sp. NPDC047086]|uniref:AAA family ATPase n=1 Tax=Nocardioides sp. NPDC047086 TaxID=3154810 RepID=UPI0033C33B8C
MHLKSIHFKGFKRFTDLAISELPEAAKLIVIAGPNGSGKSSIFDGLKTWHWVNGGAGNSWDETYGAKVGSESIGWPARVQVEFHEPVPAGEIERKKLVYIRSAFRNEADFNVSGISRLKSPLDTPRVSRLIDADMSVSDNYQRLILQTLDGVYSDELPADMTRLELRDRIIGRARESLARIFTDLQLDGVGGVTAGSDAVGTFYFSKGSSKGFLYKNLSAGEKACFDLILDAVVKSEYFDNSIWCIDEPETHLNTRIQSALLETLVSLIPENSQLLLASHSIGFMRKAWELAKESPGEVCFVDMQGKDFDQPASIRPVKPSRDFWSKTLEVALGDLAHLMAPERVVLCEGRVPHGNDTGNSEFDAFCYRQIFAEEFPDTDFLSAGNSKDVSQDRLEAGRAIQTIMAGTTLIRVIDRDLLSEEEVTELKAAGIRVLSYRNIESYLLADDVLKKLCEELEELDRVDDVIKWRDDLIDKSVARGHDRDDFKQILGEFYNKARKEFSIVNPGSNGRAFAKSVLVPLISPGMATYDQLKDDIFGS